jgi:3-deoxy-manno-octulosonate cytidylyltransferase (CMP-KDO synthetase)
VIVATDSELITSAVQQHGYKSAITDSNIRNGTLRCAHLARKAGLFGVDIVVNVQGDAPEIDATDIDALIDILTNDISTQMATLGYFYPSGSEIDNNPNCVKVVCDSVYNRVVYFSRAPVPYLSSTGLTNIKPPNRIKHVGIYAYRVSALLRLLEAKTSNLENYENLEQLRAIAMGIKIRLHMTTRHYQGIDTRADYDAFVRRFQSSQADGFRL